LQYSFGIGAERYSGSLTLGTAYSDEDSPSEEGRAWIGQKIQIRYKPGNPANSIWLAQDGAPEGALLTSPGSDNTLIDLDLNK
jgi:hypothetical protein